MNAARRKQINHAISQLEALVNEAERAHALISAVRDEESDAFENLSEGAQESERGQAIAQATELLDEAVSAMDEVLDAIECATLALGEASA